MGMFGTENSIEPGDMPVKKKRQDQAIPIREATPREIAKLRAADPEPVEAKRDAIAEKHGLYTKDARLTGTRIYFNDYQQKTEAFRANDTKITTRLSDRQTVTAILDLAEQRGWKTIKLRGTDEFKAEAWVQAQERGLQTAGYKPKDSDRQEADRRIQSLEPVRQAVPDVVKPIPVAAAPEPTAAQPQQQPTEAATHKVSSGPYKAPAAPVANKQAAAPATRERAATVWNTIETAGKQARARDSARPKERAVQTA